ncbi:MAG: biotin--[acetyl-CoA-carboxylase] ligase [Sphingobacteriales bacterium]|nr:biotin--[acetyl-CoA-carboxylase] ligase [Sphingobacteriales bacterium]
MQIQAGGLPDRQGIPLHGMAVFAHEQVAGKGQRTRTWVTEKGSNIALSVLIKPGLLRVSQQFQLSACAAVAVHHFFAKYAGDDTKIKWPNDLYWQDRKAGGILIENIISGPGNWEWAIVGIGININQVIFPGELPNPVSLKQITGSHFDPCKLAKELCASLDHQYTRLCTKGFDPVYTDYLSCLYKKGEQVRLKKDNRVFDAVIKSVTPGGRLIVQHGMEEEFDFGEVQWVL